MTHIDEIRERLDKVNLWMNQTQYGNVTYSYVTMLANAQDDLAWLLDAIARRDARCADFAVQLDKIRALHEPFEWSFGEGPVQSCTECARLGASEEEASYPCPTIRALDDTKENRA